MSMNTIKDFEIYANTRRIPLIMNYVENEAIINLVYFQKDELELREDLKKFLLATILVNHFIVADKDIEYNQQSLIECSVLFEENLSCI